jgi:hypothetical protein
MMMIDAVDTRDTGIAGKTLLYAGSTSAKAVGEQQQQINSTCASACSKQVGSVF